MVENVIIFSDGEAVKTIKDGILWLLTASDLAEFAQGKSPANKLGTLLSLYFAELVKYAGCKIDKNGYDTLALRSGLLDQKLAKILLDYKTTRMESWKILPY